MAATYHFLYNDLTILSIAKMINGKSLQSKVVVCFRFIGDVVAGSHMSAMGLIRNLPPESFEPLVVLHHSDGPLAEVLKREKISFLQAPATSAPNHRPAR